MSTNDWLKFRKKWIENNPPNHEGQYLCGICGKPVSSSSFELDHVIPRSNRPDLIYEYSNLQPSHSECNYKKGSRIIEPAITNDEYNLRRELDL